MSAGSQTWNDAERAHHESAIEVLSRELGAPREAVENLYRDAFAELSADAQIRDYLPIFISRRVRRSWKGES